METRIEYLPRPLCVMISYVNGSNRIHHQLIAIEPLIDDVISFIPPGRLYVNMDHVTSIEVLCPPGECKLREKVAE